MNRIVMDRDLELWEVFATTADGGYATPARILFRSRSRPDEPALAITIDGDTSEAERRVQSLSDPDLLTLLEGASRLD